MAPTRVAEDAVGGRAQQQPDRHRTCGHRWRSGARGRSGTGPSFQRRVRAEDAPLPTVLGPHTALGRWSEVQEQRRAGRCAGGLRESVAVVEQPTGAQLANGARDAVPLVDVLGVLGDGEQDLFVAQQRGIARQGKQQHRVLRLPVQLIRGHVHPYGRLRRPVDALYRGLLSVVDLSAGRNTRFVEPHQKFAENLRAVRADVGMSQETLGAQAGLHRTEVSLLERAERDPRLATIVKLARGLGVSLDELIDGIE
ncbi:MAG: helix-turn-helix transcriptional regulator [Patulibacter sp.]|nr:helix-turn-helix transcriptional regulator [Patulibacter sp.]